MGEKADTYKAILASPEQALVQATAALATFRELYRAKGAAMEFGRPAYRAWIASVTGGDGPPVLGDPGAVALAGAVTGGLRAFLSLTGPGAEAPDAAALATVFSLLDNPALEPWLPGGASAGMLAGLGREAERDARIELDAERRERNRSCMETGITVTLCDMAGDPLSVTSVTSFDGTSAVLRSGHLATFNEVIGEWGVARRAGSRAHSARPAEAGDMALSAARSGKLGEDGRVSRRRPLPSNAFEARSVAHPGYASHAHDGSHVATGEMIEAILPGGGHGDLLAYMIRRFGPPTVSTDSGKALCGAWTLDTPLDGVLVRVEPSVSGLDFSFRPLLSKGILDGLATLAMDDAPAGRESYAAALAPVAAAVRTGLCDMLRPVWVRDHPINALGTVPENSRLLEHGVGSSAAANIGMPAGFFDSMEGLQALVRAMRRLDPDDQARAMVRIGEMVDAMPEKEIARAATRGT